MGEQVAICPQHLSSATGICARCGRFGCAECLDAELCTECRSRPEVRLTPSPRSKIALWTAIVGLHGLVFLLPFGLWLALRELEATRHRPTETASIPWAQGALWISALGLIVWPFLFSWWLDA